MSILSPEISSDIESCVPLIPVGCVQIPILAGFAVNLLGLYFDKNLEVAGSYDLTEGALSY